ncbi:hypothetical protein BSKO_12714 [Bryopsis sp. KO-2023]|nr:hypothetical protein BSKO_12714 [Bryopsis sp. KO-2023]
MSAASSEVATKAREYSPKPRIKEIKGGECEGVSNVGKVFEVSGWVRTLRAQKTFAFMEVNDGSMLAGLQVILGSDCKGYEIVEEGKIHTGTAVCAVGVLATSPGGKQKVELKAESLRVLGSCDPSTYPLQKKRHSLEFLRGIAHLRPRTNTMAAVMRVRNTLAAATHSFFQKHGFYYLNSPLISAADCEGAGEMFQVTTLLNGGESDNGASKAPSLPINKEDGSIDYSEDFFSKPTYLTVSGQLNGEMYASAMGRVYTFGPTFRAENSNTSRHLAEFWMVEPEIAFADLEEDVDCAEAYLKHCISQVLENCQEDLGLFNNFYEKGLIDRLQKIVDSPVKRVTYTEAVDLLLKSGQKFEFPVEWGSDLQSEHERYLTEKVFDGIPIAVMDYPKDIKAFYMRLNDDGKTVAAMDLLVPGVGELIGGSQREDRLEVLEERMAANGLNKEDYWWYLDLRRYGSVPHAGFGLGFERLVQFVCGMENIRDVIPFPRYPGHCSF